MDSESSSALKPSIPNQTSSNVSHLEDQQVPDEEEPFSLSGSYIALFGLGIAIATIGIPLVAVLTERPHRRETTLPAPPTALETDGFKTSPPISFSGAS